MPEAITGTPWTVLPKQQDDATYGWTDPEHAQMALPQEGSPNERFVRLHELGHAKFTPVVNIQKLTKRFQCKEADLQTVEDLRVHSLLAYVCQTHDGRPLLSTVVQPHSEENYRSRGIDMADPMMSPAQHLEMLTWFTLQHRITYGSRGLLSHGLLSRRCHEALDKYREVMDHADNITKKDRETIATIGELAAKIGDQVAKKLSGRRLGSKHIRDFKSTCKAAKELRRLLNDNAELLPSKWGDPVDRRMMRQMRTLVDSKERQWGILTAIDTLSLPIPHRPKQLPVRTKQAVPMGARLGHIRRLITDGRAFQRIRKQPQQGGTVLIDASGSMSLCSEEIKKFLDNSPAATVAMYSAGMTKGKITIIAKNGRIATEQDINLQRQQVGGCNTIDGPVLDWLAKQPQPRIWVCDGHVTGIGDCEAPNLTREAMLKAKRNAITRYDNLEEASHATSS